MSSANAPSAHAMWKGYIDSLLKSQKGRCESVRIVADPARSHHPRQQQQPSPHPMMAGSSRWEPLDGSSTHSAASQTTSGSNGGSIGHNSSIGVKGSKASLAAEDAHRNCLPYPVRQLSLDAENHSQKKNQPRQGRENLNYSHNVRGKDKNDMMSSKTSVLNKKVVKEDDDDDDALLPLGSNRRRISYTLQESTLPNHSEKAPLCPQRLPSPAPQVTARRRRHSNKGSSSILPPTVWTQPNVPLPQPTGGEKLVLPRKAKKSQSRTAMPSSSSSNKKQESKSIRPPYYTKQQSSESVAAAAAPRGGKSANRTRVDRRFVGSQQAPARSNGSAFSVDVSSSKMDG